MAAHRSWPYEPSLELSLGNSVECESRTEPRLKGMAVAARVVGLLPGRDGHRPRNRAAKTSLGRAKPTLTYR
jgi:hypothetical protein